MALAIRVSGAGALTKAEVEQRFPEAVQLARQFREIFGDDVRLVYAKNAKGETLGKSSEPLAQTDT
jgi:hypothetical protein